MTFTEHLLTCLSEECVETSQRCCKALRFGKSEIQPGHENTNAERLVAEYIELLAVGELLQEQGIIVMPSGEALEKLKQAKKDRVLQYVAYARKCGALTAPRSS